MEDAFGTCSIFILIYNIYPSRSIILHLQITAEDSNESKEN